MRSLLHYTTRTILRRLPTAPPWVGMSNEGELKEKILALSVDERNFVRCIFGLGQRRLSLSLSLSLGIRKFHLATSAHLIKHQSHTDLLTFAS